MTWQNIQNEILSDLRSRWPNAPALDDLDLSALEMVLDPVAALVESGKIKHDDRRVWKVRFGIRNSRFRPSVSEIEEIVEKALGLIPAELSAAYSPVRVPALPQDNEPAPTLDDTPRWTKHLAPTGEPVLDGILAKALEATRRRRGEEAAVRAARVMAQSRIDQESNQRRELDVLLSPIPEEQREDYLAISRARMHRHAKPLQIAQGAARLWSQQQRQKRQSSALGQWQAAWPPEKESGAATAKYSAPNNSSFSK